MRRKEKSLVKKVNFRCLPIVVGTVRLKLLLKRRNAMKSLDTQDDKEFHGLSEYLISFDKDNDFNANIIEIHIAVLFFQVYIC